MIDKINIYIPKTPLPMYPQAFIYSFGVKNIVRGSRVWMNVLSSDERKAKDIANRLGWDYIDVVNMGPEQWKSLADMWDEYEESERCMESLTKP